MIIHSSKIEKDTQEYGGKANGLLFLCAANFDVPNFYVLGNSYVQQCIHNDAKINAMCNEWIHSCSIAPNTRWAVRSSGGNEDGATESYAGLFETVLNVNTANISDAIRRVIESFTAISSIEYGTESTSFAVVIQEMKQPDVSGVLFSIDPIENIKRVRVNAIPGIGENLVSGKETGIVGFEHKGRITWEATQNSYSGSIFKEHEQTVTYSSEDFVNLLQPFEKQLLSAAKTLQTAKGVPVDIEFCIENGTLFLLQVRPITTLHQNIRIYDNSNIGENFPGITLPLSATFTKETYAIAYTALSTFLGLGRKNIANVKNSLMNMVHQIKGGMYYNVTAWQELLYNLPFGKITSRLLPGLLGMEPAVFNVPSNSSTMVRKFLIFCKIVISIVRFRAIKRNYESLYERVLGTYENMEFSGLTHKELIERLTTFQKELGSNWIAPVLNGFFAMLFFTSLKKLAKRKAVQKLYPNFPNDVLFAQGNIVSVRIVREYQNLVYEIQSDSSLLQLFKNFPVDQIWHEIKKSHHAFESKFNNYINEFGSRCDSGELKIETVCYQENPLKLIDLLKSSSNTDQSGKGNEFTFDYRQAIKKIYPRAPLKRGVLMFVTTVSLGRIRDRENYRFLRTKTYALIRRVFRAMDEDLLRNNSILQQGDSLYLHYEELMDSNRSSSYKEIIEQRKLEFSTYNSAQLVGRYEYDGRSYKPIEKAEVVSSDKLFTGTGCCSGTVTGKVRIVTHENVSSHDFSDSILIASYFEPGWINIFGKAKGVVSEKGNLLSHTAILCREMGIPSIIGLKHITNKLTDGDIVQIDGSTGELRILEQE